MPFLCLCMCACVYTCVCMLLLYFYSPIITAPGPHSHSSLSHSSSLLPLKGCSPTPTRPSSSWGPQVSRELSISSPTEGRPGSPLLHMYWEPWTSSCMLPGWWLSVWELPQVGLFETAGLPMGSPSSSASSSFSPIQPQGST